MINIFLRGDLMSMVYVPICINCKYFENFKKGENGRPTCKAFPNGIPYETWKEKSKPDTIRTDVCQNDYKFEEH